MKVPSSAFLQKVAEGKVETWMSYSARSGSIYGFTGGEKTARAHSDAGYVHIPGASLGRPGIVRLTALGQAALNKAKQP